MADYILHMGGQTTSGYSNAVDVFKVTKNGVELIANHGLSLSYAVRELAAAACGDYVLSMGGYTGSSLSNTVDVFKATESGVEAVADHGLSLSQARYSLAAASCGNYILAMGGTIQGSPYQTNIIDLFKVTENGVEAVPDHGLSLSQRRKGLVTAVCGEYILAIGGYSDGLGYVNTIDVFKVTESGIEHITDHGLSLSYASYSLAAAAAGDYILAMGGIGNPDLNTVDVFKVTANGVEAVTGHGLTLSVGRGNLAAAACGNYILAMGGSSGRNAVDVFKVTENGVEHILDYGLSLSIGRFSLAAASAGNYVLAMGGYADSGSVNAVDVFQIFN